LTRCLNQSSELIAFFAVRILVLAFEKMSRVQLLLVEGKKASSRNGNLWKEASERLLARFVDVCPAIKDVIVAFRKIPDNADHGLHREAMTRLLQLYYEVMPLQASEAQFDISTPLTAALVRSESKDERSELSELRQLELEHLLQIAQASPGMRWLTKQGSLQYSPILALLKIHSIDLANRGIRELVHKVLSDNSIVASSGACDALLVLLSDTTDYTNIGPFLDDCFMRAARQPVKYLDSLEDIVVNDLRGDQKRPNSDPSLLNLVFLEQAPFILNKSEDAKLELLGFIASYFDILVHTGEQSAALDAIFARFTAIEGVVTEHRYSEPGKMLDQVRLSMPPIPEQLSPIEDDHTRGVSSFVSPPVESEDHPELVKWSQKDLDMAIEDGNVDALILCLCSQYPAIRTQALAQLYRLEEQLLHSTIEDRGPVYILIGELIETYEHNCLPNSESLPYMAGCFATHALHVQTNPGHVMYPKINKFLNRGPSWRINKLPNYWIENTVLSQPEGDDAYWKEVQWVLDWLVDGMRTQADLEILRKTGVFEKVMALCSSPGAVAHSHVRMKVLDLLWHVTFVDGGSTTLITRTGVLAWLDMMAESRDSVVVELKKRILKTCDGAKIEEWSGFSLEKF
jgi:nucleolar pre-ribosomal-associated protein 1